MRAMIFLNVIYSIKSECDQGRVAKIRSDTYLVILTMAFQTFKVLLLLIVHHIMMSGFRFVETSNWMRFRHSQNTAIERRKGFGLCTTLKGEGILHFYQLGLRLQVVERHCCACCVFRPVVKFMSAPGKKPGGGCIATRSDQD
jgi:hypothetical protein